MVTMHFKTVTVWCLQANYSNRHIHLNISSCKHSWTHLGNKTTLLKPASIYSGLMSSIRCAASSGCLAVISALLFEFLLKWKGRLLAKAVTRQKAALESAGTQVLSSSSPESSSRVFCFAVNLILSLVWKEEYSWIIFIWETVTSPIL